MVQIPKPSMNLQIPKPNMNFFRRSRGFSFDEKGPDEDQIKKGYNTLESNSSFALPGEDGFSAALVHRKERKEKYGSDEESSVALPSDIEDSLSGESDDDDEASFAEDVADSQTKCVIQRMENSKKLRRQGSGSSCMEAPNSFNPQQVGAQILSTSGHSGYNRTGRRRGVARTKYCSEDEAGTTPRGSDPVRGVMRSKSLDTEGAPSLTASSVHSTRGRGRRIRRQPPARTKSLDVNGCRELPGLKTFDGDSVNPSEENQCKSLEAGGADRRSKPSRGVRRSKSIDAPRRSKSIDAPDAGPKTLAVSSSHSRSGRRSRRQAPARTKSMDSAQTMLSTSESGKSSDSVRVRRSGPFREIADGTSRNGKKKHDKDEPVAAEDGGTDNELRVSSSNRSSRRSSSRSRPKRSNSFCERKNTSSSRMSNYSSKVELSSSSKKTRRKVNDADTERSSGGHEKLSRKDDGVVGPLRRCRDEIKGQVPVEEQQSDDKKYHGRKHHSEDCVENFDRVGGDMETSDDYVIKKRGCSNNNPTEEDLLSAS